jgi:hypothetical protein
MLMRSSGIVREGGRKEDFLHHVSTSRYPQAGLVIQFIPTYSCDSPNRRHGDEQRSSSKERGDARRRIVVRVSQIGLDCMPSKRCPYPAICSQNVAILSPEVVMLSMGCCLASCVSANAVGRERIKHSNS